MKFWMIPLALAISGAAHADSCETLRTEIEAKIAAAGVARFSVVTLDADAEAPGQVVGSCGLGSKKIVYQREDAAMATASAAAAAPLPSNGEAILTECKDGTVSVGGDCRK
jgi:hypothetical protein